jgi:hypothetical protein
MGWGAVGRGANAVSVRPGNSSGGGVKKSLSNTFAVERKTSSVAEETDSVCIVAEPSKKGKHSGAMCQILKDCKNVLKAFLYMHQA